MGRRANGEGSIYRLANGKWRVQVEVPVAPGRPRRRLIRHRNTKTEAVAALQELRDEAAADKPDQKTVGQIVAAWMDDGRQDWAPATIDQRERAIAHLSPLAAGLARDLRPHDVAEFFKGLECGARIRQVAYDVLKMACDFGAVMEYLPRNPCTGVRRPKVAKKKIRPFEPKEAERILKETEGTRWHAFILLSLTCGPRQAELFGLEWSSVDLKGKRVSISTQATDVSGKIHVRNPKTVAGVRSFDLPKVAAQALLDHKAILLRSGLAGGSLVFPAPEGGYMDRGRFRTRVWKPLLKRLGLEHRGPHHMRHTYATLALGAGVAPHVVAAVLGHKKPSTTLDLYAHAIPSQVSEAAETLQRLFG